MKPFTGMLNKPIVDPAMGGLWVVEDGDLPFTVRRFYCLYGVPEGGWRGGHAHRLLQRLLVVLGGAVTISIDLLPSHELFTFPMRHKDGLIDGRSMTPGGVDGGQFVYRSSLIGDLRYNASPTSDGEFASALAAKTNTCHLSSPVLPYNALR